MDETEALLLWRWSTMLQLTSLAMVSACFALLARADPRPDLDGFKQINDLHGHAAGIDTTGARAGIDDVAERMKRTAGPTWCGFSVGVTELTPGGSPEQALQIADQNMYKAKNRDRR